jgi:alpha-glucosidase (family GH31 glycosyl hydrolase)
MMKRVLTGILIVVAVVAAADLRVAYEPSRVAAAAYPAWAHAHWVWLGSSQANRSSEMAFVRGFLDRDVPVGAVDLDSQWATGDNNFVFDTAKYPDPAVMVAEFHALGVRVILWATSVVDTDSPNFQEGKDRGYFLTGLFTDEIKWWHGVGSFIDYTNPDALAWWHAQMDLVLDMGVDGFKNDGTDPYIFEMGEAYGYAGVVSQRDYANMYYSDFFNYARSKNPEALIMSRPVDSFEFVYWNFSPRDVVFAGWVGDQDPDFSGLQDALRNILHSAWQNYVNFGSDIGGYRHGPGPNGRTKELFIRWAQMGAFCPLMENGGDNQHRPWMFDNTNETLDIYRTFVHAHMELGPYFLAQGSAAFESGGSVIHPVAEYTDFEPSTFAYKLGPDVFVNPITVNGTDTISVSFPSGDDWVDWWNTSIVYAGDSTINYAIPLDRYPAFHRKGSLLPLNVTRSYVGHGDVRSADALTLLLLHPVEAGSSCVVREFGPDSLAQECSYTYRALSSGGQRELSLRCTGHPRALLLQVRGVDADVLGVERAVSRTVSGELEHRRVDRARSLDQMHAECGVQTACFYVADGSDAYARGTLFVRSPGSLTGVDISIILAHS